MWLKPGGGGSALSSEQSPPSGSGTGSGTGSGGRVGEKAGRTLAACTLSEFNQSPTDSLADTLAESWVKKGKRKRKKRISRQRESGESSPKEGRLSRQVFASAVCFKVTRRCFLRFFFFFFFFKGYSNGSSGSRPQVSLLRRSACLSRATAPNVWSACHMEAAATPNAGHNFARLTAATRTPARTSAGEWVVVTPVGHAG